MAKEKRHYATEAEIADIMAKNGWSRDDAEFYLIDKYDEVVFPDETDEVIDEHKQNLKIANVYDNKKGKRKVTRKPDEDKRELIEVIAKALEEYAPEVKNVEREVTFTYKGANYSVTLTKHRG
jgi:phage terminase large subunit-like protein